VYCVVPLAGPDFYRPEYGIRPLIDVDGRPLLRAMLESRPWVNELTQDRYVFVLREERGFEEFKQWLKDWMPQSRSVVLSHLTPGALLSAMVGVGSIPPGDEPLIVDLADIGFSATWSPSRMFGEDPGLAAIAPYFESTDPCYSYLKIVDGLVKATREKEVISNHASAGVYLFRDQQTFLQAAEFGVSARMPRPANGGYFLCPALNGLIEIERKVVAVEVFEVDPVSKRLHRGEEKTLTTERI